MPNEISTGKKSNGQFAVTYQQNGYGGCIPVIDGTPEPRLMFGYASESDKNACMKLIEEALRATGGDIFKTQRYITNAVTIAANEIKPDEAIEVKGTEILISYADKKAYIGTDEIANLDDLQQCELPNEAIKAILTARIETELERIENERTEMTGFIFFDDTEDEEYEDAEEEE